MTVVISELIDADVGLERVDSIDAGRRRARWRSATDRVTLTFVHRQRTCWRRPPMPCSSAGLRDTSSNTMTRPAPAFTTSRRRRRTRRRRQFSAERPPTDPQASASAPADDHYQRAHHRGGGRSEFGAGLRRLAERRRRSSSPANIRSIATGTVITFAVTGTFPANSTIQWYTNYNSTIRDMAGLQLPNQFASSRLRTYPTRMARPSSA